MDEAAAGGGGAAAPALPDMEPMEELEALLAEAVRLGMLDRRGGAETRQRVVDGQLALAAVRQTWREILGLEDAPLTGDEVEVSIRQRREAPEAGTRPRAGSMVANAHDDMTTDTDASDGDDSLEDHARDDDADAVFAAAGDVRRLSFLRKLNTKSGRLRWDGGQTAPPPDRGAWVPYVVLSCGKFGLGVFDVDDANRPAPGGPRLQVGDEVLGLVPADDDELMLRVRLPPREEDGAEVEGLVQRIRDEGGRRRVLCAVAANSPDRPRRNPRVPLASKLEVLKAACQSLAVPWEEGHVKIVVRRETAARDAVAVASALPIGDFWKTWRFEIDGEPGMDAGGLARECWAMIAAGVLDPASAHWRFAATDNVTLQIRPSRGPGRFHVTLQRGRPPLGERKHAVGPPRETIARPKRLERDRDARSLKSWRHVLTLALPRSKPFDEADRLHYRVAGRLVAKALFDLQTIPAHLNRPMLKHLLAMPVTFGDLEYVDALLYRSCKHVYEAEGTEALALTFSYRDRDCDAAVELVPGGALKDVTDENKDEYLARLFKFAMLDVISKPLGNFLKGFYEVLPLAALNAAAFDPGDLELAIAGLDDIDVDDWRKHTDYSQGYADTDAPVLDFWHFVASLPLERRAKLLQFVTGTSRLPAGGFANLQGRDGVTKVFELRKRPGGDRAFPVAHTCFNRLDLPEYSDIAVLSRILSAILDGDVLGFSSD